MQLCWSSKLSFFSTISFYSTHSYKHHFHLFVVLNCFTTRKSCSNQSNYFLYTGILYSITCWTCWWFIWTSCYSCFEKYYNIRTSKFNKINQYLNMIFVFLEVTGKFNDLQQTPFNHGIVQNWLRICCTSIMPQLNRYSTDDVCQKWTINKNFPKTFI